jgi:hypothetical protein
MSDSAFDAYQDAVEQLDTERWMSFYADGAEWLEYRHSDPPRSPNHARERGDRRVHARNRRRRHRTGHIEREVVDDRRAAYMLTATLPDGRQVVENVILDHRDGGITPQIDVEAWN